MNIEDLDTPVLTVDLEVMEKNIQYMAEHCRKLDIQLRPHIKTHKVPEIAHMQLEAGANGIACQKLGEAEVMAAAGIRDILITYNIVGEHKLDRLSRLAKRVNLMVTVDSIDVAYGISKKAEEDDFEVGVLVELDTGGGRCGVQSPKEALKLAKGIIKLHGLNFKGIMTYPSHERAKPFFEETFRLLRREGLDAEVISGGGTGHEATSKEMGCTETRSGSYIFEGPKRIRIPDNPPNPETCALRLIATVVSIPTPNRVIVDAGEKSLTLFTNFFHPQPPPSHYGYIVEYPEAKMRGMYVEHGLIDASACKHKFKIGERISIIPVHQGMTLNLHDELVGVRKGKVEVIWQIAARGKYQ